MSDAPIRYLKYGNEIVISCPYCGDKKGRYHHKHLYINIHNGKFICFLCGKGGAFAQLTKDHPQLVSKLINIEIASFVEEKTREIKKEKEIVFQTSCTKLLPTPVNRSKTIEELEALAYLAKRGIPPNLIIEYGLALSKNWKERIIFPCMSHQKKAWDYYMGRLYKRGGPKWRKPHNSEGLDKSLALFGLQNFYRREQSIVIITEGPIDAIACRGVALLGKKATALQLRTILELFPKEIVIALDKDAQKEAKELSRKLRSVVQTSIVSAYSKYNDPGGLLEKGYTQKEVMSFILGSRVKV